MWQAWYLVISIYILRGRRGTYGIALAHGGAHGFRRGAGDAMTVGVARVALGFIDNCSHVAGVVLGDIDFNSGVAGMAIMALGLHWSPSLVLGVALGTPQRLAWPGKHYTEASTFVSRGRRGTW